MAEDDPSLAQLLLGGIERNPTAEEQQQQVDNNMRQALLSLAPPREQRNPTAEQQQQQVDNNMRIGLNSQSGTGGALDPAAVAAYSRPINSPEDQNWSDENGQPIHVGLDPPSSQSGRFGGGYDNVFHSLNSESSNGGLFNLNEYDPTGDSWLGGTAGQGSGNGVSTNNWRLLAPQFRDPDNFLYNGQVISRRRIGSQLAPKSVLGLEGGTGFAGYRHLGTGGPIWATPTGSYSHIEGPIGSLSGWSYASTPTY